MYYVEGYANIISVSNTNKSGNNKKTKLKFIFNSDRKGIYSEPIYAELKENLTDNFNIKKENRNNIVLYKSYDLINDSFTLEFSIDFFVSKCDCHLGIYFDISETKNTFDVKRFDIIL